MALSREQLRARAGVPTAMRGLLGATPTVQPLQGLFTQSPAGGGTRSSSSPLAALMAARGQTPTAAPPAVASNPIPPAQVPQAAPMQAQVQAAPVAPTAFAPKPFAPYPPMPQGLTYEQQRDWIQKQAMRNTVLSGTSGLSGLLGGGPQGPAPAQPGPTGTIGIPVGQLPQKPIVPGSVGDIGDGTINGITAKGLAALANMGGGSGSAVMGMINPQIYRSPTGRIGVQDAGDPTMAAKLKGYTQLSTIKHGG